jgi:hypothetical protein
MNPELPIDEKLRNMGHLVDTRRDSSATARLRATHALGTAPAIGVSPEH